MYRHFQTLNFAKFCSPRTFLALFWWHFQHFLLHQLPVRQHEFDIPAIDCYEIKSGLPGHSKICNLVDVVVTDENVSGCQITVNATLYGQKLHSFRNLGSISSTFYKHVFVQKCFKQLFSYYSIALKFLPPKYLRKASL